MCWCAVKKLLTHSLSPTCLHNMVNFGSLAAEIVSLVWGTPGNFNRFRFLAALLHSTLTVGVSQTAVLNRGRHLYSAARPSRWALTHISSVRLLWPLVLTYYEQLSTTEQPKTSVTWIVVGSPVYSSRLESYGMCEVVIVRRSTLRNRSTP